MSKLPSNKDIICLEQQIKYNGAIILITENSVQMLAYTLFINGNMQMKLKDLRIVVLTAKISISLPFSLIQKRSIYYRV